MTHYTRVLAVMRRAIFLPNYFRNWNNDTEIRCFQSEILWILNSFTQNCGEW